MVRSAFWCALILCAAFPSWTDSQSVSCLTPGEYALQITSAPSLNTPKILETLAKNQLKAVFYIKPEKLQFGGVNSIIQKILAQGHMIGVDFSVKDLSSMSEEGLNGSVNYAVKEVADVIGKIPMFVYVRPETPGSIVQQLGYAGYVVYKPTLYLYTIDEKTCLSDLSNRLTKTVPSIILNVTDDAPCAAELIQDAVDTIEKLSYHKSSVDTCLGLASGYRNDKIPDFPTLHMPLDPPVTVETPPKLSGASENAAPISIPLKALYFQLTALVLFGIVLLL